MNKIIFLVFFLFNQIAISSSTSTLNDKFDATTKSNLEASSESLVMKLPVEDRANFMQIMKNFGFYGTLGKSLIEDKFKSEFSNDGMKGYKLFHGRNLKELKSLNSKIVDYLKEKGLSDDKGNYKGDMGELVQKMKEKK